MRFEASSGGAIEKSGEAEPERFVISLFRKGKRFLPNVTQQIKVDQLKDQPSYFLADNGVTLLVGT